MSVWAAGISAVGSIAGGYLAGKGNKQQTYIPRRATKNAERDRLSAMSQALYGGSRRQPGGGMSGSAEDLYTNPDNFPEFAPRPFTDPNAYELSGIEQLGGFATTAFPELYQRYADTAFDGMDGEGVDGYVQSFRDVLPKMQQYFQNGPGRIEAPTVGFNPNVELRDQQILPEQMGGWRPNVAPTVTADANPTLQRMLSGNADVQGLTGAVDAYLKPIMENFNSQVLPSLQRADAAATGGQSSAGALKASQRVLEGVGEGVNRYTQGLLYDASQRGLDRAGAAAGLVTQGRQQDASTGLAAEELGQRGLFGSRGIDLDLYRTNLGTGLSYDQLMANLMEGNADRSLTAGTANAGLGLDFGNQLLDLGRLGAGTADSSARTKMGFAQLMPNLIQTGMAGPQALLQAGSGLRGLMDPYAKYNADRFSYEQNLPYQMNSEWMNILRGLAPQTTAPAQAGQGSGGNVGSGIGGMLSMLMAGMGGTSGNPSAMSASGEAAAQGLGGWSLAGGLTG